jgi:outer membrane protein assembly factor BamD (BamD/ComL family)
MRIPLSLLSFLTACGLSVPAFADSAPLAAAEATPDAAAEQMRLAEGLISRNFHELALAELRKFLRENPNHERAPQATLLVVECLRARGDADEAVRAIDGFLGRWPNHAKASALLLLKSEILIGKGDVAGARQILGGLAASADEASREAAAYYLAQADVRDGKAAAALAALGTLSAQSATAERPFRAYAALGAGALCQQRGDWAGAEAAYRRLADAAGAPAGLREEAFYRLAELSFTKKEYRAAADGYSRLLKEFPAGAWAREAGRRRAWALFHAGEYAQSATLAGEWRATWGEKGGEDMLYLKGLCLAGQRRFAEAREVFQGMLSAAGLGAEHVRLARFQSVFCLIGMERWTDALAAAQAFMQDYPKAPEKADILYFQGEALFRLERWADAAAALRQALDSFSGDWALADDCAGRLGECLGKLNRPQAELAAVYRSLAGRAETSGRAGRLLRAGELERAGGKLDAAAADFQKVRREFTGTSEARAALLRLAELEAERKDYTAAAGLVKELAGNADGAESRGRVLLFTGFLAYVQQNYPEAEKSLRQAVEAMKAEPAGQAEARFYLAALLAT